ncbi:MAG: hypothetical protein UR28_C0012G0011 [Candidatus Peregrinibacteria bacterium GW2011_GWF2_33_10]|nr:MAG: hypothetical protein UR28_C0012G0011 [Candidatus Peregrinibacteria bacterium GW2011_GWF2_33_10]OGJ44083.1 MAG: hypothetical protein A2263_01620 [Candidatus Peregrinibacteria bacterium RIFOXYA2_FULL_33_21]OGJ45729.1 MAG: hypothetical protein A2272_03915 [Candidatus Peregrinibacteria bacterium RIFOXYA12_FULL_33_12]OGJ51392.1 MAG: hypothetical protein A2307_02485 [Candidatus Peregrinibacteria bacterium RIFOXYB2_FULL_33_20]
MENVILKRGLFILAILFLLIILVFWYKNKDFNAVDKFARCLTENNVVMYGVDYCQSCQNQKQMFGDSFKYIKYINCDFNRAICQDLGVSVYPVWMFENKPFPGVKSFQQLSDLSVCSIKE